MDCDPSCKEKPTPCSQKTPFAGPAHIRCASVHAYSGRLCELNLFKWLRMRMSLGVSGPYGSTASITVLLARYITEATATGPSVRTMSRIPLVLTRTQRSSALLAEIGLLVTSSSLAVQFREEP